MIKNVIVYGFDNFMLGKDVFLINHRDTEERESLLNVGSVDATLLTSGGKPVKRNAIVYIFDTFILSKEDFFN